ncbi:MAG TPA: DUF58 domain-containing protein [Polyangia bacterium]|jgi:uncharacterized protein (DUF58 family)
MTPPAAADADAARGRDHAALGGGRFDERFLRKLESLVMAIRRSRMSAGLMRANRVSKRVGAGLEFADHRDYAAGDDPRYIDWNLYGRLGRLALRLFEEEEDLLIEVLVDASASMGVGSPAKLDLALQIGAALGYVGLANLDRVALSPLGEDQPPALPPARGKGAILPILRFLNGVRAGGRAGLAASVRGFVARRRRHRRALAIVISDFYDPAGPLAALDLLRHHRLEVVAIQVSAREEVAPDLRGDIELRDVETGETRELTVSPAVLAAYRQRHQTLLRDLEGYCRERAIPCFTVVSDQPFDAVVLRMFRAGGLLR